LSVVQVVEAHALPGYKLRLRFSDGTNGVISLRDFIMSDQRAIVQALKDESNFAAIHIEMDTVVWNNGFDLAPEFLYARAKTGTSA
jgi:hypothetical protein